MVCVCEKLCIEVGQCLISILSGIVLHCVGLSHTLQEVWLLWSCVLSHCDHPMLFHLLPMTFRGQSWSWLRNTGLNEFWFIFRPFKSFCRALWKKDSASLSGAFRCRPVRWPPELWPQMTSGSRILWWPCQGLLHPKEMAREACYFITGKLEAKELFWNWLLVLWQVSTNTCHMHL